MLIKVFRGIKDIILKEVYKWCYVENKFREICVLYGYEEMVIFIFEYIEFFKRSVGDIIDIV